MRVMQMRLFLAQLQTKSQEDEPEPAEAASEAGAEIEEQYADETAGPAVLRPGREDIHAILVNWACKLEDRAGLKKA